MIIVLQVLLFISDEIKVEEKAEDCKQSSAVVEDGQAWRDIGSTGPVKQELKEEPDESYESRFGYFFSTLHSIYQTSLHATSRSMKP